MAKERIYLSEKTVTLPSGRRILVQRCGPDHPIYKGGPQSFVPVSRPVQLEATAPPEPTTKKP